MILHKRLRNRPFVRSSFPVIGTATAKEPTMNYREIYTQARALTDPWSPVVESAHPFDKARIADAIAELPDLDVFIPTKSAWLNSIIRATGARFSYNYLQRNAKANEVEPNRGEFAPYYDNEDGIITLPPASVFFTPEDYAGTLTHELGHWT